MNKEMEAVLKRYIEEVSRIFGSHLKTVILYGSYARGDNNKDSDIDIMILLDLSDEELIGFRSDLSDATFDFNIENDMEIMPIAKNYNEFYNWIPAYPFYSTVESEGIKIYEAA